MWKFYTSLNGILGTRPAIRPAVILDTSDDTTKVDESNDLGSGEEEDVDETEKSIGNEDERLTAGDLGTEEPESGSSRCTIPAASSTTPIQKKKRKRAN